MLNVQATSARLYKLMPTELQNMRTAFLTIRFTNNDRDLKTVTWIPDTNFVPLI